MTSQELINQFRFNQMTLTRLLADVSQEDSMKSPTEGNCINFMLGHLLATRGRVLKNVNAEPKWLAKFAEIYTAGSMNFPSQAKAMEELVRTLDASMEDLAVALAAFEPKLSDMTDHMPHLKEGTWADRIGSFICHEAYHCGQIGLARRAMGKPGLF